jgi:AcrR family transcriptional regulator
MVNARTAASTRWAGVPVARRKGERHDMLLHAAFTLFGAEGEAGLTVRAVCRKAELHTRYFYENFAGTGELLAAVYDQQATALGELIGAALDQAGPDPAARTRAGIRCVLRFISDDPRRGRVLFGEAHGNEVLAARRRAAQTALLEGLLDETSRPGNAGDDGHDPALPIVIAATMFVGAMAELAQQWADGRLGDDLDAVVDHAVELSLSLHVTTAERLARG